MDFLGLGELFLGFLVFACIGLMLLGVAPSSVITGCVVIWLFCLVGFAGPFNPRVTSFFLPTTAIGGVTLFILGVAFLETRENIKQYNLKYHIKATDYEKKTYHLGGN